MTKILLVEDDKSLREIYGVRLLAEGYDIVSAGDGEEALAMAIKERPELIISDVMMPKISGFDMLDILRSTTETRDIKVIMMTALSSDDQRARGEQLGADRYLVKSQVGIEDVVRTVHEVMEDAGKAATAPAAAAATPAPAESPAPAAPAEASEPKEESSLPQPTAPFSSPKPDNLGERVINPIENPNVEPSVSSKIDEELASADAPAEPAPAAPVPEPVVAVSDDPGPLPPQPEEVTHPTETTPAPAPEPAPAPAEPVAADQPADESTASDAPSTDDASTPAPADGDEPKADPVMTSTEDPAAPAESAPAPAEPTTPETPAGEGDQRPAQ